ncbi:MAG: ABC transporter permease [Cyanobacteriota bacterium]|nr:ABC transporter permease [Cyanobacteriota bacterium]
MVMGAGQSWDMWGVYSVWRRHAKVYQKTWLVNFLPPVTEPLVYLLAFGYGLTPMVGSLTYLGQEVSYLSFMAPGMIAVAVLFQAFFEGAYGSFIRLHYQRTWHALLTAPMGYAQVFVGDWLWATTRGLISGLITAMVTVLLGLYPWTGLLGSLPFLLLGSLLFAAMGLLTTGLVETIDQVNVPIFTLVVPMFVLCGTYFPRDNLPLWLKGLTACLPLSGLVDCLRWPLGLDATWPLQLFWLIGLMALLTGLSYRQIFRKLFR